MQKIGKPHAQVAKGVALTIRSPFVYSVADLMNDVKGDSDDTFSNDVYANFGMKRRNNLHFEPRKISERDGVRTNRELLMMPESVLMAAEMAELWKYRAKAEEVRTNELTLDSSFPDCRHNHR